MAITLLFFGENSQCASLPKFCNHYDMHLHICMHRLKGEPKGYKSLNFVLADRDIAMLTAMLTAIIFFT